MIYTQIQNYKILSLLGEGGMATVYLAEHNLLGNQTAFKLLNKEFVYNENIRKRFLAEARSMARMSHPNIIKVTDLIDEGETVAFVMEYVEGETLKEFIERKGKLSDDDIKSIFSQMLDAVGYVHKQNLVHRDIKPSNFMVDPEGKVKLMDFGIAKNTDANAAEYTQTGTGVQMGTPMYMSPEQVRNTKEVTFASDIYSLGVVLWQMVTGEKPYDTKTLSTFELQLKIVQDELPQSNSRWDAIIGRATSKKIEERFESCHIIFKMINSQKNREEDNGFLEKTVVNNPVINDNQALTKYPSVKIGEQIWMTENLNVSKFRNGDIIHEAKTDEEWKKAGERGLPACCYYENNTVNGKKYGKLYNWYAVNDTRGLAPEGWKIPKVSDWDELQRFSKENICKKIKSTSGWSNKGNDQFGFKGLPGGSKDFFGFCSGLGESTDWWSSTENEKWNRATKTYGLFGFKVGYSNVYVVKDIDPRCGLYIRCIRV